MPKHKRGRPREGRSAMNCTLTLSYPLTMWRVVKACAKRRGCSMSKWVRAAIYNEIQRARELDKAVSR